MHDLIMHVTHTLMCKWPLLCVLCVCACVCVCVCVSKITIQHYTYVLHQHYDVCSMSTCYGLEPYSYIYIRIYSPQKVYPRKLYNDILHYISDMLLNID